MQLVCETMKTDCESGRLVKLWDCETGRYWEFEILKTECETMWTNCATWKVYGEMVKLYIGRNAQALRYPNLVDTPSDFRGSMGVGILTSS